MSVVSQSIALGLGTAGALVDVTAYVNGPEGTTFSYGRSNEFQDPSPGVVTFTLDNYDGRFTPGNPSQPYTTPIMEGTKVSWLAGARLWTGIVTSFVFGTTEEEWGRVSITCGDPLTIANRTGFPDLAAAIGASNMSLFVPFSDPAGSSSAATNVQGQTPFQFSSGLQFTFGVTATAPTKDTQCQVTAPASSTGTISASSTTFAAGTTRSGAQLWVTPISDTWTVALSTNNSKAGKIVVSNNSATGATAVMTNTGVSTVTVPIGWVQGTAHHIAIDYTVAAGTVTVTLYIDGAVAGTATYSSATVPSSSLPSLTIGGTATPTVVNLAHLASTTGFQNEAAVNSTTESALFTTLCRIASVPVGTVDAALSTWPIAPHGGTNVWASICDILRTEQGHVYPSTTGTLLAPSTVVNLRARTRPISTAVTLTLDAVKDLQGIPQFVRDLTNLAGTVTASGPTASATVADAAAIARVGSASASENVDLLNVGDLYAWASDRLLRGENANLRIDSLTVDTNTAELVTAAQLLALNPGDRIRVINLPNTQLGFTQWDGWLLGVSEAHNVNGDLFTLRFAPVLADPFVYDTAEIDATNEASDFALNGAITNVQTAIATRFNTGSPPSPSPIATSGFPYYLTLQATPSGVLSGPIEIIQVSACGAPVSGVQNLTVARGQLGTTALAWSSAGVYAYPPNPTFAF